MAAATDALADKGTNFPGESIHIPREPFGVVLCKMQYESPLVLSTRAIAAPIIAGNTTVLCTEDTVPVSCSIMAEVFREAGLPAGVLSLVHFNRTDYKVVRGLHGFSYRFVYL